MLKVEDRFTIFFAVWIGLGLALFCFFHFNRNARLKRWVFPFTLVATAALFMWFVVWVSNGALAFVMPVMIPAVGVIALLNWFMTRFCASCGRTVVNQSFFLISDDCPYCGAPLNLAKISREAGHSQFANRPNTAESPSEFGRESPRRRARGPFGKTKKTSVFNRVFGSFFSVVAAFFAVQMYQEISDATKLKSDFAITIGHITSEREMMHGVVDYAFEVSGEAFRSADVGGRQRDYGAAVTVYYYPADPSVSSLGDPRVVVAPGWYAVVMPAAMSLFGLCMAVGWIDTGQWYGKYLVGEKKTSEPNKRVESNAGYARRNPGGSLSS